MAAELSVSSLPSLAAEAFNGVVKGSINTSNNHMAATVITLEHKGKSITLKMELIMSAPL